MATKAELLASSLEALKEIQGKDDFLIVRSSELSRTHLKRLVDNRFLTSIITGWYVVTDPLSAPGDTTAWYASFWKFASAYSDSKYGDDWVLSAEQSLSIYSGSTRVPTQIVVRSTAASNNVALLIGGNSIFNLKAEIPSKITKQNGLNLYSLEEALIVCAPSMYQLEPLTMRTALSMIKDSSDILKILVDTGQTTRAGRLVGAFRNIGRADIADDILSTMKRMGYDVREDDPFEEVVKVSFSPSPYATRIRLMWQKMRDVVVNNFALTKSSLSKPEILAQMEAKYKLDAYHSLSIEGYRVTESLIERVKSGNWQADNDDAKSALAARGYYQAFQLVKKSVEQNLGSAQCGAMIRKDMQQWHAEMFMPCVEAGIIKPSDIVGYRSHQVYIRNSMHTPLNPDALRDAMETLYTLLEEESNAEVRAILGHFIFTYIHPFMDGNGRIGRFIMNTMLVTGGYDWLIIPVERRDEYMAALEKASVEGDILPFVEFVRSVNR